MRHAQADTPWPRTLAGISRGRCSDKTRTASPSCAKEDGRARPARRRPRSGDRGCPPFSSRITRRWRRPVSGTALRRSGFPRRHRPRTATGRRRRGSPRRPPTPWVLLDLGLSRQDKGNRPASSRPSCCAGGRRVPVIVAHRSPDALQRPVSQASTAGRTTTWSKPVENARDRRPLSARCCAGPATARTPMLRVEADRARQRRRSSGVAGNAVQPRADARWACWSSSF